MRARGRERDVQVAVKCEMSTERCWLLRFQLFRFCKDHLGHVQPPRRYDHNATLRGIGKGDERQRDSNAVL